VTFGKEYLQHLGRGFALIVKRVGELDWTSVFILMNAVVVFIVHILDLTKRRPNHGESLHAIG